MLPSSAPPTPAHAHAHSALCSAPVELPQRSSLQAVVYHYHGNELQNDELPDKYHLLGDRLGLCPAVCASNPGRRSDGLFSTNNHPLGRDGAGPDPLVPGMLLMLDTLRMSACLSHCPVYTSLRLRLLSSIPFFFFF